MRQKQLIVPLAPDDLVWVGSLINLMDLLFMTCRCTLLNMLGSRLFVWFRLVMNVTLWHQVREFIPDLCLQSIKMKGIGVSRELIYAAKPTLAFAQLAAALLSKPVPLGLRPPGNL